MSKIDDELAQAVAESEAQKPAAAPLPPVTSAQRKAKRSLGLLIALLVMGGGILALVFTSFDKAAVYSKTVDQLLAQKEKLAGRSINVNGILVKGTLKRRVEPCEYRFTLK